MKTLLKTVIEDDARGFDLNILTNLLADDHTIVRKGLCSLLGDTRDFEIIGEAENGREAVRMVEAHRPDVVVMDISMPVLNGLEATKQIKKRFPDTKVLILTMHINEEYIFEIIKAGASGYVVKMAVPEELVMAVRAVSKGDKFFSPAVSTKIVDALLQRKFQENDKLSYPRLTRREREVLQLIAEGHSNRKIADILFISVKTVETHRYHIMEKLDLHSAAELTRYSIQKGIISTENN